MAIVFEQALDVGEPKRLLIFGANAESGSIDAAAHELGWSQPALSRHANALEKGLGVSVEVTVDSQSSGQATPGKSIAVEGPGA